MYIIKALLNYADRECITSRPFSHEISASSFSALASSTCAAESDKMCSTTPDICISEFSSSKLTRDAVQIVAVTRDKENIDELFILSVLEHVYANLRRYFGAPLTGSVLQKNFDSLCLLLDEMLPGGYPFSLELNNLESTVVPVSRGLANKLVTAVSGKQLMVGNHLTGVSADVWWRRGGVVHSSNEFYLDVVDRLNCIVDSSGLVISGSISGRIDANCKLSGIPELLLSFKKEITQISLHPCVRRPRWKRERKLSFVPPDGTFTLAEYCLFDKSLAVLPFHLSAKTEFETETGRIDITLSPKLNLLMQRDSQFIEQVFVSVTLPNSVSGATLVTQSGCARFDGSSVHWAVGKVGAAGANLQGSLTYTNGVECRQFRSAVCVDFLVRGWSVSGVKIDSVEISGIDYTPYKGCRYSTTAGRIDIRV